MPLTVSVKNTFLHVFADEPTYGKHRSHSTPCIPSLVASQHSLECQAISKSTGYGPWPTDYTTNVRLATSPQRESKSYLTNDAETTEEPVQAAPDRITHMDQSLHETGPRPDERSSTRGQTGHNVWLNTLWAQDPYYLAGQNSAPKSPQSDPQTPTRTISTSTSDVALSLFDAQGDDTPSPYDSDAELAELMNEAHGSTVNGPGCRAGAIAENVKIDACEHEQQPHPASRGSVRHPDGCRPCHFHRRGGCTEGTRERE